MRSALPKLWPVAAAATILGMVLGAALFATFGEPPTRWAAAAQRSEWLGFTGAVIGGVCTVGAGVFALLAVSFQLNESERRANATVILYIEALQSISATLRLLCKNVISDESTENARIISVVNLVYIRDAAPVSPSKEDAIAAFSTARPDLVAVGRRCIESERLLDTAMKMLPAHARMAPVGKQLQDVCHLIQQRAEVVSMNANFLATVRH